MADFAFFTRGGAVFFVDGVRRRDFVAVEIKLDDRHFRRYGKELTARHSPDLDRLLDPATVTRKALGEFDA